MLPAGAGPVPYWRLSAFYFFYFAVLGAWLPYWSLYLQDLGYSALQIGYLAAIMMATKVVAPNIWGWVADRSGRRMAVIQAGSLLSLLSFGGILVDTGLLALALVIAGFSFFWNAVLPQFEVVTMSHLGNHYRFYSRIRLWGSVGFIAAVAALGTVFDHVPIAALPWVLGALLAGMWISSLSVNEVRTVNPQPSLAGLLAILRRPPVLAFLASSFLLQVAHGPYYTFFSIHLQDIGYDRTATGLLWSLGVMAEVLVFLWMHHLLARFPVRLILLASLLLAALRWCLIGWYSDVTGLLLLAQCLHAASFGSSHAVAIELVRRFFDPGHQGQGMAIYSGLCFGGGGAVGAVLSGMLWDFGAAPGFAMAAGCCLLAFGLCLVWLREPVRSP